MLEVLPISAFQDNYIWLLRSGNHAAVVDPGDAVPVISVLEKLNLQLDAILITHHHADHIDGVMDLLQRWPAITYAPKRESYSFTHTQVEEGDEIVLPSLGVKFDVMEVPGHTLGHVAYYGANCLFCGDTLFSGGCGRLFEGTPEQMYTSLQRFAQLPPETAVYCTHEYTEHNLSFARRLEPHNPQLINRQHEVELLRKDKQPTLPSSIGTELETNPFLRCHIAEIQLASGIENHNPIEVFSSIRRLRNNY